MYDKIFARDVTDGVGWLESDTYVQRSINLEGMFPSHEWRVIIRQRGMEFAHDSSVRK